MKKYYKQSIRSSRTVHQQMTAAKNNKRNPVQLLIFETTSVTASRNKFLTDLCYALVTINIPFNKQQSTPLKNFLQKNLNQNIPDESTLRKNNLV
ncbi:DUF659 domain-containing protein [Aphis craccivora]|uniref:DUF659 domain-containing protein n=1 Tax=Aphis craccivora TaxID=307492 RepID=A0A6G0Y6G4_APHCR|nr:DUF659 domain-containing protein [Aphis craccivora]